VTLLAIERHDRMKRSRAPSRMRGVRNRASPHDRRRRSIDCGVNPDGKAISANRVASSTPDCHSRRCSHRIFANGCSTPMTSRDCMRRGARTSGTMRLRMSSACSERMVNTRWFLIQYKPVVDDDGHVACWYATGTDIEESGNGREQAPAGRA